MLKTLSISISRIIIYSDSLNPSSAIPTKWSNTLKQFVGKLPTNCLSVFGHFVGLALKGLKYTFVLFTSLILWYQSKSLIILNFIFSWCIYFFEKCPWTPKKCLCKPRFTLLRQFFNPLSANSKMLKQKADQLIEFVSLLCGVGV